MSIYYITGNKKKFTNAKKFLEESGIHIEQKSVDVTELQSDNGLKIAKSKVEEAFKKVGKPLIINDANWSIPSLNNFPGPYMKYINNWFNVVDFLNLIKDYNDRSIVLTDIIVYKDEDVTKVFTNDIEGVFLDKPGSTRGSALEQIVSLDGGKNSISDMPEGQLTDVEERLWQEFASWLKSAKDV